MAKVGVCSAFSRVDSMMAMGFDYVELSASGLAGMTDEARSHYETPRSNLFFPSGISLFNNAYDRTLDAAQVSIEAAAECGVEVMVVGSGAWRNAPANANMTEAHEKFLKAVAEFQGYAIKFEIKIAPESLNRSETNVGNDLGAMARLLRTRGVGYTADSFHALQEARANSRTADAAFWEEQLPFAPLHVHMASAERLAPSSEDPEMIGFAARLKALKYKGTFSLELGVEPADWAEAQAETRKLLAAF